MNRSKKISMIATALLCFILKLSACSNGKTATNEESAVQKQAETNAMTEENQKSNSSETRIYKDSQGHEVEIPTNPKRIVLQGNAIGDLLALGIQPIGIDRRFIESSVNIDKEQKPAQDIGFPTNLELVLSLEPDLTMLSYVLDKEYEEASKISPVVTFDGALPLKVRFPVIADIVGKKAEAGQLLQDYDLKAEAMWKDLRVNGKITEGETAVVLQYYWNKTMYVMKTGALAELLYQPSGFGMDDKVKALQPNSGPYIEVSNELMHDILIGDRLFVLHSADKDAEKAFAELLKTDLWKSLPAVKGGKINFIEDKWNYNDMTTSDMLLDEFPNVMEQ
ncbi:ABC transporter substrate-binding protein [Sporosarcina limicola]|uniref:Iron complex transport system substrate-binding protein n=1 Tax=Sporosarcina limicola TaxID=34101 RepID=A0A927RGJ6_9BACL|nr:ABC transporter substrate-binding protein [Sporosarcina limicola]MBE1556577.1 iron complex transport system substrate-binding protein [Sporosarcina limicola]